MTTVSFDLPDDLVEALGRTPGDMAREMRLLAAMAWYGRGELSQEAAATLAGLSRAEFLTALAAAGRDVFVVDFDDLQRELARG